MKRSALQWDMASALLIAIVFVLLAWNSWMKWTHPTIDFGSELYVPWQLQQGAALYKDLASFKGPFSPYLNLLWYDLFGVSLRTIEYANIVILALITIGLTALIRICTDRLTATVCAIVFLVQSGFADLLGRGNFNYVTPMVHELTHGVALSIALLLILVRITHRPNAISAVGAGLILGCIALTRVEVGVAAIAATIVALIFMWRYSPVARPSQVRTSALLCITAIVPPVIAFAFLSRQMPWQMALNGVLGTWKSVIATGVASTYTFQHNTGLSNPLVYAMMTFISFLFVLNWIVPAVLLDRLASKKLSDAQWMLSVAIILGCAVGMAVNPLPPFMGGRPLPLIAITALGWVVWQAVRHAHGQKEQTRWAAWTIFSVYAIVFIGKILLNARVRHYGFAHAMPALMIAVMTVVWLIPFLLRQHGYRASIFRSLALMAVCIDTFFMLRISMMNGVKKTDQVGTGNDAMLMFSDTRQATASVINHLLDAIDAQVPPDATLTPVPEGLMINYLSRHRSTVPVLNFMITEMAIFGEENVLQSFQENPPDYIALIQRDTSDFGYPYFGADPAYGKSILDWIHQHYRTVWSEGPDPIGSKTFSAALLKWSK